MIIRARNVVTMDGAPIKNGAVRVSESRIIDVGKFEQLKSRNSAEIVDLGEQTLLPGLVNAHCHLDYTCLRGKIAPQKSFSDWIRAINAEKAKLLPKDYFASINDGLAEAKRFGTTTIANLTAFPELVPQIQPPIRIWWFAELIDVRTPGRANELVNTAIELLRSARPGHALQEGERSVRCGLAPHALFTASQDLFRHCEGIAERDKVLLTTHLAESREEMEMFRDASGRLYEFLKSIGRPMDDCGNNTPLRLFLDSIRRGGSPNRGRPIEVNRPDSSWIVVHLNELTANDFDLLERSNTKLHVVHCPRSHDYFGHSQFVFERLRRLGFNICLGTDSLASNETLSLFAEMRAFQTEFPGVSPEEILRMVTGNPARALRQENALGKIRAGAFADLIAVPFNGGNLFEEIVAFTGEPWVMMSGRIQ